MKRLRRKRGTAEPSRGRHRRLRAGAPAADRLLLGLDNAAPTPHLGYPTGGVYGVCYGETAANERNFLAKKLDRVMNPEVPPNSSNFQ